MNNIFPIKPVFNSLTPAIRAARESVEALKGLEVQRAHLGTEEEVKEHAGTEGVRKRAEALEAIEQERRQVVGSAQKAIADTCDKARGMVSEFATPQGGDVQGQPEADLKLLEFGLVDTPEQLMRLRGKHNDSLAFWIGARNYAASKEWGGFAFITKAAQMVEFVNTFETRLKSAAADPASYDAIAFSSEYGSSTVADIAKACGLENEFKKDGITLEAVAATA